MLDAPLDSAGADRLWSLSQGNLLYLRHLVDGELRSGRLRKVAGVWQWPEAPALSAELAEIVRSQMGQLPGGACSTSSTSWPWVSRFRSMQ